MESPDDVFLVGSFLELEPLLNNRKLTDALCLQTSKLKSRLAFCILALARLSLVISAIFV